MGFCAVEVGEDDHILQSVADVRQVLLVHFDQHLMSCRVPIAPIVSQTMLYSSSGSKFAQKLERCRRQRCRRVGYPPRLLSAGER